MLKMTLSLMMTIATLYLHAAAVPSESYLTDRIKLDDKRYLTYLGILELLNHHDAKIIVETGTSRDGDRNFNGDGGSTVIFADWATQNNAFIYSVDIDPQAVKNSQIATDIYADHVQVVCEDSISFLTKFDKPIDFLYLDSFDFDFSNPITSQEHHLKEIIAACPKLSDNSIVMIDDCDLPEGGKGKLVIQYLTSLGWVIFQDGYQVIMIQNN